MDGKIRSARDSADLNGKTPWMRLCELLFSDEARFFHQFAMAIFSCTEPFVEVFA